MVFQSKMVPFVRRVFDFGGDSIENRHLFGVF